MNGVLTAPPAVLRLARYARKVGQDGRVKLGDKRYYVRDKSWRAGT